MYKIVVEIPEGLGGGVKILLVKKWKFRGGGGVWIFSGTTQYYFKGQPAIT